MSPKVFFSPLFKGALKKRKWYVLIFLNIQILKKEHAFMFIKACDLKLYQNKGVMIFILSIINDYVRPDCNNAHGF